MSSEYSKTRVGAFVLGGLGLLVVALLALGNDSLFGDNLTYVMYFDGSVSGLSNGAPVVFRGVPMGHVTQISLEAKPNSLGVTIPVQVQLNANSIVGEDKAHTLTEEMRKNIIHDMIQRGLRARLQMQSFITGQYRIELDFFPNTPAEYVSTDRETEIPTIPSPLDELQRTLTNLPVSQIANRVDRILQRTEQIVTSPDITQAMTSLRLTFERSAAVMEDIKPLSSDLRRMVNTTDAQLPEAVAAFQLAMNSFAAAADQINATMRSANALVARDSRTMRELETALKEFSEAARAIRGLSNMLERHPESLLLGKGGKR